MDAQGHITRQTVGNNIVTLRTYDPASGYLSQISTGLGSGGAIQSLKYTFDPLGNLRERLDRNQADLTERFKYDKRNRLTRIDLVGIGQKHFDYDSLGNITQKGSVTDYAYGAGSAGPHALTLANGKRYGYDKNGNMTWGSGRTLKWTSYNKPKEITKGTSVISFDYGPDRARYRQIKTDNGVATTTLYLGKLYEQISTISGTTLRHYIYAGSQQIAIYDKPQGAGSTKLSYVFADHLGSTDVVTTAAGVVTGRLSFNAFGGHRKLNWQPNNILGQLQNAALLSTTRGFTGHEQLDVVGLIHMNGRVYDPELGRFISADPQIQYPSILQSYNRYSYVHNNPLSYTDPSGFGFDISNKIGDFFDNARNLHRDAFRHTNTYKLMDANKDYIKNHKYAQTGIQIAASFYGPFAAGLTSAAIVHMNGGTRGEITRAGVIGVISSAIGGLASNAGGGIIGQVAASAVAGGVIAEMSGGDFKTGFITAGITAGIMPSIANSSSLTGPARVIAAAVVGGTVAEIGGGKFANGAKTFAFMQLLTGASNYYESAVGRKANPLPGKNIAGQNSYDLDPNTGQQLPQDTLMNVIGLNREMDGSWLDFFTQGGPLSKVLNIVPVMNATGGLHDYWFNSKQLEWGFVNNLGSMVPAAAISTGAVFGNFVQGWESNPMALNLMTQRDRRR